jgi:hypothetical protein
MIAFIIKFLIDVNGLLLQITKDKEVNKIPNVLEKNYQFIKVLHKWKKSLSTTKTN